MKRAKKFPKRVFIYACDHNDGALQYTVAERITDIPEESAGERVGIYELSVTGTMDVGKSVIVPGGKPWSE